MAIEFKAEGKWKSNGPGKFKADIQVEGAEGKKFPVTLLVEFDTKTGKVKKAPYRNMTAALRDDAPMPKAGKITVIEKKVLGKNIETEHDF